MFQDFKNGFPKNHFGILIYILSRKHLFDIYFRFLRRNKELKINDFLTNIWRDIWRFSIWRGKRTQFYCLSKRLLGRFVFMVVWGCSDHRNTKQYKKVPILDLSSTCVLCKTKQSISVKIGNGQYAVFRARYLEKKSNYVRR